jgi:hypothetical protein
MKLWRGPSRSSARPREKPMLSTRVRRIILLLKRSPPWSSTKCVRFLKHTLAAPSRMFFSLSLPTSVTPRGRPPRDVVVHGCVTPDFYLSLVHGIVVIVLKKL